MGLRGTGKHLVPSQPHLRPCLRPCLIPTGTFAGHIPQCLQPQADLSLCYGPTAHQVPKNPWRKVGDEPGHLTVTQLSRPLQQLPLHTRKQHPPSPQTRCSRCWFLPSTSKCPQSRDRGVSESKAFPQQCWVGGDNPAPLPAPQQAGSLPAIRAENSPKQTNSSS